VLRAKLRFGLGDFYLCVAQTKKLELSVIIPTAVSLLRSRWQESFKTFLIFPISLTRHVHIALGGQLISDQKSVTFRCSISPNNRKLFTLSGCFDGNFQCLHWLYIRYVGFDFGF